MLRPIKLPRCFRLLTTYSPNEAMTANFNGDSDSGDRDDRHAPVQGDDDAPRVGALFMVVGGDEDAPVQGDEHAPVQDEDAPVQGHEHAPVQDDDRDDYIRNYYAYLAKGKGYLRTYRAKGKGPLPAVGIQGDGAAPDQNDGHAPVANDDFVPADGEPLPNRRRIEVPPQHRLQRRNCEDPLQNIPDEDDEELTQPANDSQ